MANYVVTIRTKDGSLSERDYTANDRAELFKKLAADGVTAVRVSEGAAGKKPRKAVKKAGSPSKGRGLLAAALLVLVGGVVAFYFYNFPKQKAQESENSPDKSHIETKKPAKASPKKLPSRNNLSKPERPASLPPQRIGEIRNGYRLLPSGRLHRVRGVITSGVARVSLVDKTFNCHTDRMIAHLLMAEFGGTVLGGSEDFFKGFNKSFEESLKEDVVINADDSEDVKELKQAVLNARNEILAHMKDGKDAESVMIETRDQLLELSLYREDLEKEVLRLSQDGMTQEEYDELISAANQMLSDRGCKGVQMPRLVADAIQLRLRHEEARQSKNEAARSSEINQ